MRNSSSIGACAPVDVSDFSRDLSGASRELNTCLIRGAASASTVVGRRPTFLSMGGIRDPNYKLALKEALEGILQLKAPLTEHTVILCGEGVSVSKVSQGATMMGYSPSMFPQNPSNEDLNKLRTWLQGRGGLLVTSNLQFSGMEAFTCVFITNKITADVGVRSGLLRATTKLVVISYESQTKVVNLDEVKRHFLFIENSKKWNNMMQT